MTSDDKSSKTASEMVSQLHALFQSREKALKEREEALKRRLKLFEEHHPQAGKDSDVLHLNVGGSTNIAVLRRTLTHFENSMLASRFSGRWDDSLEKDIDGKFYIDQDPQNFGILLKYLRQCDQRKGDEIKISPPAPTFDFCFMLDYYDLMSSVYPQRWLRVLGTGDDCVVTKTDGKTNGDSLTISSGTGVTSLTLEVQRFCPTKPTNATAFTVVFEKGATGQVGWGAGIYRDRKLGNDEYNVSFAFDLDSSQFMGNRTVLGNGHEWDRRMPVEIRCTYNVATNTFSIQVLGEATDAIVMATFHCDHQLYPFLNFLGKATVSDVSYYIC